MSRLSGIAPIPPALLLTVLLVAVGCQSPSSARRDVDRAAGAIISEKQKEALGRAEPFSVERPAETLRRRLLRDLDLPRAAEAPPPRGGAEVAEERPEPVPPVVPAAAPSYTAWGGEGPLRLTLLQSLQVGARNSREYQSRKEEVFRAALNLDLERDEFRNSFAGLLEGYGRTDRAGESPVGGTGAAGEVSLGRTLKSGAAISGRIALDLVRLLTQGGASALGLLADATVSIPLLRGSGRHIVTEPLIQAERDVLYALWSFERYKRTFAVQVARDYLAVLRQLKEVDNAEENYRSLVTSSRRARRLADAGRLPEFQFDQSVQNELRSRNRWITTRQSFQDGLDAFKVLIGLPADAPVELVRAELESLAAAAREALAPAIEERLSRKVPPADEPIVLEEMGRDSYGPLELSEARGMSLAFDHRLDLREAQGKIHDAERRVVVTADALRAELTLFGSLEAGARRDLGSAGLPDGRLDFDRGRYNALLALDFPLERTEERNDYRESFIRLEEARRDLEALEDKVKMDIRRTLRALTASREGLRIQALAVELARRRVKSTDLFLQAGRAEVRDVLEAQDALLTSQNALTSALVGYRVAELELQRDLGLLQVNEKGLWQEFNPEETDDGDS